MGRTGTDPIEPVTFDSADLTTHGVILGMTRGGQDGVCHHPARRGAAGRDPRARDRPQGDLGLALRFPELSGEQFAPWVGEADIADPRPVIARQPPSTLIERSWAHRRDLDLARLIGQVLDPPLRKLGVFDLDTFSLSPPDDRRA